MKEPKVKDQGLYNNDGPNIDGNFGPWASTSAYESWLNDTAGVSTPKVGTIIGVDANGYVTRYIYTKTGTSTFEWRNMNYVTELSVDSNTSNVLLYADKAASVGLHNFNNAIQLPAATATKAGVMTAADKSKLDSLSNNNSGTQVTGTVSISLASFNEKKAAGTLDANTIYFVSL